MKEFLTNKGIVLAGEAAQSWVDLQWAKFIVGWTIGLGLVAAILISSIIVYRIQKENE